MKFHIREARERAGYSQKELAQIIGVAQNTFHGYESGKHDPKSELLNKIADACNVTVDFLLGRNFRDDAHNHKKCTNTDIFASDGFSDTEQDHIKKYRLLDPYGKEAVDVILDVEWRRCETAGAAALRESRRQTETAAELAPEVVEMLVYVNPAAAGTPLYAESDFERLQFPADEVPRGADFGIRISGRSMEPTVMDGAIVWVRKRLDFLDGTVGVFMLNDSAVCKRFFKNGDSVTLESDNPEFDSVSVTEFDTFIPVGEVIGTI